ncbi:MAG TPA: ribonuclease III [Pyrinomonadaceae bacterium]|nr:ribonuclease III [Pyrinomonadaceae bacterium]
MAQNLSKLEQIIGYKFKNIALLERAVTHRSWAFEKLPDGGGEEIRDLQNESLEFVGDSVVGLAVAEQLFVLNPKASEGDLTLMKHHLVSTDSLAKSAKSLGLSKFIRMGRGEEKTGGRKKQQIQANTLEAIIAAVFFDSGYVAARSFVKRIFAEELKTATPRSSLDFKTLLQETLQAQKLSSPTYRTVKTEGLPHERIFHVEASWENGTVKGKGTSIKAAEMMAANAALKKLEKERKREKEKGEKD